MLVLVGNIKGGVWSPLLTPLQEASSRVGALCGRWQQLQQEGAELVDFFCEDHQTFRLDDCFSIFTSFCCRFSAAIKVEAQPVAVSASSSAALKAFQGVFSISALLCCPLRAMKGITL